MDALNIIADLREYGLEPTIIDIGLDRAVFRLAVKINDTLNIYYAGKCLNKYLLSVEIDGNYLYFENVPIDEKVFMEIFVGAK
jgi:hypothetical protein